MTINTSYVDEVRQLMSDLDVDKQRKVVEYVRSLKTRPRGIPGYLAVRYARELNFPKEDLEEIRRAIEEDSANIDDDSGISLNG